MSAGLVRCSGRGIPVGVFAVSSGSGSVGSVGSCVIRAKCDVSDAEIGIVVRGIAQIISVNAFVR